MSSKNVEVFYLVGKDDYDKYVLAKTDVGTTVENIPKRVAVKIKKVLLLLAAAGLKWNILGCVTESPPGVPLDWNILDNSAYAVSGNGVEPRHFPVFLDLLINTEAPLKWFSLFVQKKLIRF